jgi:hypothetical protein
MYDYKLTFTEAIKCYYEEMEKKRAKARIFKNFGCKDDN